jgi:hypothetical protein
MRNKILVLLLLLSQFVFSQENQKWSGYFSYNNIKDIGQSDTQVFVATENAYFKRDNTTNQNSTFSTVDGLSGQNISQIYYSSTFKKTMVGHSDGLLIIVNEDDGSVLNVVDILNKPSIPPNKKKINHFMEYEGKIYISTDFGIVVYNLSTLQFGDTYFVGPSGSNIEILQTTVYQGSIYAVANGFGILKASVTNPNLIDFNQWTVSFPGSWIAVESSQTELVGANSNTLSKLTDNTVTPITTFSQAPIDLRYSENKIVVTTQSAIYLFDNQLQQIEQINNNIPNLSLIFSCASIIGNKIYIGTASNGLFIRLLNSSTAFENVTPDGPNRNRVFGIESTQKGLWAVYGDYDDIYNPYPLDAYGISKYDSNRKWNFIPYEKLFDTKSIVRIVTNPNNENQVYFSSHYSGLLKFENDIPSIIYNASNSSLISIPGQIPDDIRVNGAAFDKKGALWVTNALVDQNLHVLKADGQWQGYNISCILKPRNNSLGRLTVDKNGTKWIGNNANGLIAFNEANNKCIAIDVGVGQGNLSSSDVKVTAVDNKNKLWIGTAKGLRILSNVDAFLNQIKLETSSIIILDDGLPQELLFEQSITDIVVDGANNKWIGTAGSGVFYISSDGQKTFNIFTRENSPLPSNSINDIDINNVTGEVFIATDSGLVSFKGDATKGTENLNNVFIYPNPVRPEYSGMVNITGLMNKSNVKVTDIEGNLVYEGISEGGTVQWNADAFGKYKVASGVYMVFVTSEDGAETTVKKVMVIR